MIRTTAGTITRNEPTARTLGTIHPCVAINNIIVIYSVYIIELKKLYWDIKTIFDSLSKNRRTRLTLT